MHYFVFVNMELDLDVSMYKDFLLIDCDLSSPVLEEDPQEQDFGGICTAMGARKNCSLWAVSIETLVSIHNPGLYTLSYCSGILLTGISIILKRLLCIAHLHKSATSIIYSLRLFPYNNYISPSNTDVILLVRLLIKNCDNAQLFLIFIWYLWILTDF